MENLKFIKRPKLKNPYLIVAWPGMGEVAFKAAKYLVEQLHAQEFAQIPAQDFFYFTGSVIKSGLVNLPELPESKFYYWKNPEARKSGSSNAHDYIIFLSNAQPDLARADAYCKLILKVAELYRVAMVIGMASMPQAIDHTQDPAVWYVATSKEVGERLKHFHLNKLSEGQISGMNGLFLGVAKTLGIQGFCLLGEVPLYTIQIENPKASCAVLEALSRVLAIKVDLAPLTEQVHMMEGEINKLLDYLKVGSQGAPPPIGEDEIEKIKHSLSQLTKLPLSVKEKIDKLFAQAKGDVSKANELKSELDKWNVYKEYEDKFLDLFKKPKGKDN